VRGRKLRICPARSTERCPDVALLAAPVPGQNANLYFDEAGTVAACCCLSGAITQPVAMVM